MNAETMHNTAASNAGVPADRLPPQAPDVEMAVLGAMLMDRDAVDQVLEVLEEHHLYRSPHQHIFRAITGLFEKNEVPDIVTVGEELQRAGKLDAVGGHAYLTECVDRVTSAANAEYHANIVLEKAILRHLKETGEDIVRQCMGAREEATSILDKAEAKILGIAETRKRKGFEPIKNVLHETFEIIDRYHKRKGLVTGVPTGFKQLDEMTSGLQPSDLILIAGRPSMGKTAFCLNVARNAAVTGAVPTAVFSLEMSSHQLALRLLCSEAHISSHDMRTGKLSQNDWALLSSSMGDLSEAKLFIDDTPSASVLEVRAKARRLKHEHDLGLIIIDYLQLMSGPKDADNRQQEVSHISRSLKGLAKELNVPVIALSQLSRAPEARGGDKKPVLSDLRESGALEQDADVVMFIHRDIATQNETGQDDYETNAEIIIGKQRNGPVGNVPLNFIAKWTMFADPAGSQYAEQFDRAEYGQPPSEDKY